MKGKRIWLNVAEEVGTLTVWAGLAALYWVALKGILVERLDVAARTASPVAWVELGIVCLVGMLLVICSGPVARSLVGIVTIPLREQMGK
jgi:hypothetical protein